MWDGVSMLAEADRQEAIAELEPVARTSSDEPDVHFLLGKCYLKTRRNSEAIIAFTTAREINPKLEGAVRSVLLVGGVDMEDDGM